MESGQEEVFKRNGVHSQMSQRFISFSMGITLVTKLSFQNFFPEKLLGHLSCAMGTAPVAKLFFYSDFGFRF